MNGERTVSSGPTGATSAPGLSPTAKAFGAEISIGETAPTLFYVIARKGSPDAAVDAVGGRIVSRLLSERQALALAPLAAHTALRDHRELELAGPVMIDAERFNRFGRMVANAARASQRTASQSELTHDQTGETQ